MTSGGTDTHHHKKHSVLFVCLGNICRSPMAEIIFTKMIQDAKLEHHWHIDSAGTAAYHCGDQPDGRTLSTCEKNLEVRGHHLKARQLTKKDFKEFEYILCMDQSNLSNIKRVTPEKATAIVKLLGSYDPEKVMEVDDPYYGGRDGFEKIFVQITRALKQFLQENP